MRRDRARAAVRFAVMMFAFPACLFIPAGRLDWPMAWALVVMLFASTIGSRILAFRTNPDLIAERASTFEAKDIRSWDRVLMPLVGMYGPLAIYIVAGLDHRFSWPPPLALLVQLIGLAFVILSLALASWAMAVNKFFAATARIQKDRGQTVVTAGPYRYVRHPGYAGGALTYLFVPVMLDALWAWIPAAIVILALAVRTAFEDRMLKDELEGYQAYAAQVRYRLLPGVW